MSSSSDSSSERIVEEEAGGLRLAGEEGADGREGAAVERAGAEFAEGAAMLGRGVALVRGEAVAGVDGVELAHQAVAVDLGDDGGGGDGERERVAVEEACLRAGMVEAHGVDEEVVGREGEATATAASMAMRVAW